VSDLAVAEVSFTKETRNQHKSAQSNFRAHPKMDVIRSRGASHQQFAFHFIAKFRVIWIKDDSASKSVLFRRIANNKTIAGKCKDWRYESQLRDLVCAWFKKSIFWERDLRRDARCSMMKIYRRTAFQRPHAGIFARKSR